MTLEERTEWTSALLDGKYKQGKGFLHEPEIATFCCLGVLCDLVKDRLYLTAIMDESGVMSYNDDCTGFCKTLRDKYDAESFGFRVPATLLTAEELKMQDYLSGGSVKDFNIADLNDAGMKFTRIAELIEKCVEVVE